MVSAGVAIALVSATTSAVINDLEPSPELLRTMAGIGASFFLAYVIEAAWLAKRFPASGRGELLLGWLMGFAAAGLAGIIFALILSELPSGTTFGRSEDFRLWWALVSLIGLGLLVAIQPGIAHIEAHGEWRQDRAD